MPTVLRKQGLYFARTVQTQRGVLSLSSAMIRPIVAILTGAQPRLSQKPDKAGLHPIRLFRKFFTLTRKFFTLTLRRACGVCASKLCIRTPKHGSWQIGYGNEKNSVPSLDYFLVGCNGFKFKQCISARYQFYENQRSCPQEKRRYLLHLFVFLIAI